MQNINAAKAIKNIKAGHKRFLQGKRRFPHLSKSRLRETFRKGQNPFTAILACSDSRLPVEHIFDVGIGDFFVVRNGGAICGDDKIGSLVFSVERLNVPLILILGHTRCEAIKAAFDGGVFLGAIRKLIEKIKPAIDKARQSCLLTSRADPTQAAIEANIWLAVERLFAGSALIRKRVADRKLVIEGALYNTGSGVIDWLGQYF